MNYAINFKSLCEELTMQEELPFVTEIKPVRPLRLKPLIKRVNWILLTIFTPLRWLIEIALFPHPVHEHIERERAKAIRMVGPL